MRQRSALMNISLSYLRSKEWFPAGHARCGQLSQTRDAKSTIVPAGEVPAAQAIFCSIYRREPATL